MKSSSTVVLLAWRAGVQSFEAVAAKSRKVPGFASAIISRLTCGFVCLERGQDLIGNCSKPEIGVSGLETCQPSFVLRATGKRPKSHKGLGDELGVEGVDV